MSANTDHYALPIGSRLMHYEIKRVLGAGGFGVTYLAWDMLLEGNVAIKEYLPMEWAWRTNDMMVVPRTQGHRDHFAYGRQRFLEEARTLNKFNDPNIVRVKNFLEANGTAYMVMDYVEGETLKDLLAREGTLREGRLLELFIPLLKGLRAVHRGEFLHRDIKPGNIYLRLDGSPVLIDFGAARQAFGEQSQSLTAVLSPKYAPFEQYSSRSKQGPWTDLYAVGATLYQCICGHAPIESSERIIALRNGEADPMVSVREIGAGKYSDGLISTIDWLLQPDAKDRPQQVESVLEKLGGGTARPILVAEQSRTTVVTGHPTVKTQVNSIRETLSETVSPTVGPDQAPQAKSSTDTPTPRTDSPVPKSIPDSRIDPKEREVEPEPPRLWLIIAALIVIAGLIAASIFAFMKFNPPGKAGRIQIKVNVQQADIVLDGSRSGQVGLDKSLELSGLTPGSHTVEVAASGHKTFQTTLEIQAGELKTLQVELQREHKTGEPAMVRVNRGCFTMGSAATEADRYEDEDQHEACVDDFYLAKFEVSFEDYDAFALITGRTLPDDKGWGRGKRPVIGVTWQDALAYSEWLSGETGQSYRLPSEAEWEYTARAGSTTAFFTGSCIHTDQANYNGGFDYNRCGAITRVYRSQTLPVGSLLANQWGIFDMAGNVWEWTCSSYDRDYQGGERRCADKTDSGQRVIRGGSWGNVPGHLRAAYRSMSEATNKSNDIGFRVAKSP